MHSRWSAVVRVHACEQCQGPTGVGPACLVLINSHSGMPGAGRLSCSTKRQGLTSNKFESHSNAFEFGPLHARPQRPRHNFSLHISVVQVFLGSRSLVQPRATARQGWFVAINHQTFCSTSEADPDKYVD
jgi:hypothetical protein